MSDPFSGSALLPNGRAAVARAAPAPYDPAAAHVGGTTDGSLVLSADVTALTAHLGASAPDITHAADGSVDGSVALSHSGLGGRAWPVLTRGGVPYAIVPGAAAAAKTDLVDLSDPSAPAIAYTLTSTTGMVPQDALCLGATHLLLTFAGTGGGTQVAFEVWDLSPLPSGIPTLLSTQTAEAAQLSAGTVATGCLATLGETLIVASALIPGALWVYDLTAPAAPVLLSVSAGYAPADGLLTCTTITALLPYGAHDVLVLDDEGSLFVVSLATLAAPETLSAFSLGGTLACVGAVLLADGTHLAVAANDATHGLSTLAIVDLSDSTAPLLASQLSYAGEMMASVARWDDCLFVASVDDQAIDGISVLDPLSPMCFGAVALGETPTLVVPYTDTLAAVNDAGGNLSVIALPQITTYPIQLGGFAGPRARVSGLLSAGTLESDGAATARGHTLLEGGAVATETITPDRTITVYTVDGTAFKIPAVLA